MTPSGRHIATCSLVPVLALAVATFSLVLVRASVSARDEQQPESQAAADEFLALGIAHARRFNGDACLRLRTKELFQRWQATTVTNSSPGKITGQTTSTSVDADKVSPEILELLPPHARSSPIRFMYVWNQKAGSRSLGGPVPSMGKVTKKLFHGLDRDFIEQSYRLAAAPPKATPDMGLAKSPSARRKIGDNVVPFTIISDPLRVFLSGMATLHCYFMPRALQKQGDSLELVRQSISAFVQGASLDRAAKHAWPQALKIDVALEKSDPKFNGMQFIGVITNASQYIHAMVPSAGHLEHVQGPNQKCEHERHRAYADLTTDDWRAICKLIEIDYVCFDVPVPPECAPFLR